MRCVLPISLFFFFFFNDTATTEIYTLSLHDALPISLPWFIVMICGIWFTTLAEAKRRSEEHTSELQSLTNLVCRLLLEKKKQDDLYFQLSPPEHYEPRNQSVKVETYGPSKLYVTWVRELCHTRYNQILVFFFFNDTATPEIYPLSLHDALPIWQRLGAAALGRDRRRRPSRPDDRHPPGAVRQARGSARGDRRHGVLAGAAA